MAFLIALLLFAGFVVNVTLGAVGGGPLVGIVAEMVILFGASICFVIGILQREAARKRDEAPTE